jgi:riboflavin biosynthesis pyrimidine reductase
VRLLLPDRRDDVTVGELYGRHVRPTHGPYVVCSMIASADGAAVIEGSSAPLGSPADLSVLLALRAAADVVLVGAGTVRADAYGAPSRPGLTIAVVTRSAKLDFSSALFASGAGILVTTEDTPPVPVRSIRAGRGDVDFAAALALLEGGVVLCEGGPSINAQLFAAGLVDELCLTVSPLLAGGDEPRIAQGTPVTPPDRLHVVHVAEDDHYLFVRYVRS